MDMFFLLLILILCYICFIIVLLKVAICEQTHCSRVATVCVRVMQHRAFSQRQIHQAENNIELGSQTMKSMIQPILVKYISWGDKSSFQTVFNRMYEKLEVEE